MILITGGAGFIGSNLAAELEQTTDEAIVICDRLRMGTKWRNLARRNLCDIINPDTLSSFLKEHVGEISLIFHMGAISSTTEQDADLILKNNFKLSMELLQWCTMHTVCFIYASSAATYGDGSQGFVDDDDPTALAKFTPLNAYAWSKHWFDRRIIAMKEQSLALPPQWIGLKFFNVYGPNEYHKGTQQSVVAHIYRTISEGGHARLFKSYRPDYADGEQGRDFVFVNDCIKVMLWFVEHKESSGIYNVGTGQSRTFVDLAHAVYTALDKKPKIEFVDMPDGLNEKYQYFTEASVTNLQAAGYNIPFTPLEEGVRHYVQDHLTQKNQHR